MDRYQCQECLREFARSDSLRRHKSSRVCKAATTPSDTEDSNMSDALESSRDKKHMSDLKGEDIFGKYDDTESKEDSETAESDMEADEDTHKRKHDQKKKHKPSHWDRLIEREYDSVQERFNETVETALEEDSSMEIEEAEDKVFEEMKPIYRSALMARYQDLVHLCSNLKRDPTHKEVLATANRLRDDE